MASPDQTSHTTVRLDPALGPRGQPGPAGELYCWYACTVKGGRELTDMDAVQLSVACEALGAGEILLNSIDQDGQKAGFDIPLVESIKQAVSIPVIASSGAGRPGHFVEVFSQTPVEAALAAGVFHRKEVSISEAKAAMVAAGLPTRYDASGPDRLWQLARAMGLAAVVVALSGVCSQR